MPHPDERPSLVLMGGEPFIFVSYARADHELVYPEIRRLKGEGYRVWCDRWDIQPGLAWADEIYEEAIEDFSCSCFVVFATRASAAVRVRPPGNRSRL